MQGDSGGPMVVLETPKDANSVAHNVQIGIVSGTIDCASKPGIFANLADQYYFIHFDIFT